MAGIGCGIVLKMHAIIDEYHTQMSLVDSMRSSRKLKKKENDDEHCSDAFTEHCAGIPNGNYIFFKKF